MDDVLFDGCMRQPETDLNLARAALLIARDDYPDLNIEGELDRLDNMAAEVRSRLPSAPAVEQQLAALNEYLFNEVGFSGNNRDYYDPRNSFLNEVLARKLGIPITLSVVYLEVGWRLGLQLQGVGFPGHFLVKAELEQGIAVLDPFFGGRSLSADELLERLQTVMGDGTSNKQNLKYFLAGVGKKEILARVLRNLRSIYLQRRELLRALAMSNRLLAATPDSAVDIRDRAKLLEQLECPGAALNDYRQYLRLAQNAEDQTAVQARIAALERQSPLIN